MINFSIEPWPTMSVQPYQEHQHADSLPMLFFSSERLLPFFTIFGFPFPAQGFWPVSVRVIISIDCSKLTDQNQNSGTTIPNTHPPQLYICHPGVTHNMAHAHER